MKFIKSLGKKAWAVIGVIATIGGFLTFLLRDLPDYFPLAFSPPSTALAATASAAYVQPAPTNPPALDPSPSPVHTDAAPQPAPRRPVSTAVSAAAASPTPPGLPSTKPPYSALRARKPTSLEIRNQTLTNLWKAAGITLHDITAPNTDEYAGTVPAGGEYLVAFYWCTKSKDLLDQNMNDIETFFSVEGETLPEDVVFVFDSTAGVDWQCRNRAVVLSGWEKGKQYVIAYGSTFKKELFDGELHYPPGNYIYRLTITAE